MSDISNRIEALAELYSVNVLILQEWYLERLAIMEADSVPDAEQAALDDVERELEGRA